MKKIESLVSHAQAQQRLWNEIEEKKAYVKVCEERHNKLNAMLKKYDEGKIDFIPANTIEILKEQSDLACLEIFSIKNMIKILVQRYENEQTKIAQKIEELEKLV